jgi:hypothetical protein
MRYEVLACSQSCRAVGPRAPTAQQMSPMGLPMGWTNRAGTQPGRVTLRQ